MRRHDVASRGRFGRLAPFCGIRRRGEKRNLMTEAIGVVAPATRRAAGAITLARVLWWMALLTIVVAAGRVVATYDGPLDHLRRTGAYRGGHAAARRGPIHLRGAAPAAGAHRRRPRPLSRRLPLAARRRHVDRGAAAFLCEIRPSRYRDADPGESRHPAVHDSLPRSGLALDRAAMSARSRALSR